MSSLPFGLFAYLYSAYRDITKLNLSINSLGFFRRISLAKLKNVYIPVYTPQISRRAAFVLRRIAWGLGTPMTKALNHAILAIVPKLNHKVVCAACKDQRCSVCPL